MRLTADASSTSAVWLSPGELEGILAATWRTPPTPPVRPLKSDSEGRASGWTSEKGVLTVIVVAAALAFVAWSRRSRPQVAPAHPPVLPHPTTDLSILDPVRATLAPLTGEVADRARDVAGRLATELGRMNLDGLPPIHANVGMDGAILVEWTHRRRRLGINIEAKSQESSWYFVSFDPDRASSASGPLSDLDLPVLLRRLAANE